MIFNLIFDEEDSNMIKIVNFTMIHNSYLANYVGIYILDIFNFNSVVLEEITLSNNTNMSYFKFSRFNKLAL
jgi:hypothetical protein